MAVAGFGIALVRIFIRTGFELPGRKDYDTAMIYKPLPEQRAMPVGNPDDMLGYTKVWKNGDGGKHNRGREVRTY